jgi:hypothetical protein
MQEGMLAAVRGSAEHTDRGSLRAYGVRMPNHVAITGMLLQASPWSPPHCADRMVFAPGVVVLHQDLYHTLLRHRKRVTS